MYCCNCGDKESFFPKERWCAYCNSPTTRPFDPWGPRKHRRRELPICYTRGRLVMEAPLIRIITTTCWLAWWLARGSAYGIWLCLRPQLSVPAEGWRIITRYVPPGISTFIITFLLMCILL